MRKSREFDNVLDECLERLLVKGETLEQCLQSFPEHADELEPLLETALATKEASAIQPRPEFRDRARYQFYSALKGIEPKKSRLIFDWQLRWATVVAIVLALLLAGGGGTVAAAAGSMPDEPLYPVKLATEQAQLLFTPSTLGKAELYATLADKRVLEIVRMADESKPEQIELTAQRLDAYLTKIIDLASTQGIKERGGEITAPVVEEAPVAEEALVTEAALEIEEATTPREPPSKGTPGPPEWSNSGNGKKAQTQVERKANLKTTVQSQAANNSARLRALLETAPESAKPALLRAIAVSETGYKKALESLD
ncbi:DUF5667 domain-containing protein [Chloroflexota bacterium]